MFSLLFDTKKICLFCQDNKEDLEGYICQLCREKIDHDHKSLKTQSPYLESSYYSIYYNRFIKSIIHDFKFNDKSYLYRPFGDLLLETINRHTIDNDIDVIYYVPLHRRKKARRGYNQSQLLASYLSKNLSIPLSNNLKKFKSTKDQHRLNKIQRQTNLLDSFTTKNDQEVKGKNILLIDDLITTGATLDECARLLKAKEANKVIGLCLASANQ